MKNKLLKEEWENYPLASRVHPLRTFGTQCFIKREDELGFSISGNKLRKYCTLIPFLRKQGYRELVVLGGPFSNNVLAVSQLLIQNGIRPTLFLCGSPPTSCQGNFLFLQMLVPSSNIHWIPRKEWKNAEILAAAYAAKGESIGILPEGAALFPSFLGALTLPLDILRNEQEMGLCFEELWIDVGTGWSAAALLLGFAYLRKQTQCHLLLLADTEEKFLHTVQKLHANFEEWLGEKCPMPSHFTCHIPKVGKSFGSSNSSLFQFIADIARTEGLFLDPIYSGKLFQYARNYPLKKNSLLIHSGGALSLSGFQEKFI